MPVPVANPVSKRLARPTERELQVMLRAPDGPEMTIGRVDEVSDVGAILIVRVANERVRRERADVKRCRDASGPAEVHRDMQLAKRSEVMVL